MEGYGDVTKLYAQAMDSAGTTQKKFDLYLQGTEAQLNQLKDTWQAVWMSAFNSKDLQNIIGLLNNLGKGFQSVVGHIGILPTALGAVTTALLLLNTSTRTSILNFGLLSTSLVKAGDSLPIVTGNARIAQSALYNLTLASRAAGVGFEFLGTMAKGVFSFIATTALPVAAIMAVSFAIEKVTQSISDANQKQQEAKQKQDELVKSYSSSSDQINKLASKYEQLSNQVSAGKISSSNQDFLDTMNQLGKLMPDLVVSEDEHGNKILASADAVKKELDYAKQLKEIQDKTTIANFEKDLDSQASKIDTILKNIDKYKNEAKGLALSPMVQSGNSKYFDQGSVLEAQRQQLAQERELQLALQNSKSYIQDKAKAYMDIEGTSQKLSSSQQKIITSYINEAVASKKTVKDGEDFKKFLSDTTSKAADLAAILALLPNDITNILSIGEIGKLSDKQISALRKVGLDVKNGGTNWDEYRKILEKAKIPAREISQIIYGLSNNLKENTSSQKDYNAEVQKTIDTEMQKATASEKIVGTTQSLLDQTKDQVIVYQQLSSMENLSADQKQQLADAIGTLSSMYPEYAKNGELNIEQIQKEISADGILLKALTDVKDGHANAEETMTMNMALQTKQRIQMIKDQISSYQKLVDAIIASAEADGGTMTGARSKVYEDTSGKIADLQKQLDDLTNTYDGQIKTLSDTQSTTNKSIYVTDQYKNSIDALDASLKKLQSETENYARGTQAYEDALQRQINLLKQKKDLTDAQAKSLQQQIASGNIVQTGMITNSSSSGSSSSSSNYNYASGNSIAAQIWNFLKGKGLTDGAIAGIMGNLQQESSLNPNSPGGGLAQWIGSRGTALKNYAGSMGLSPNSLQAQLGYLWQELSSGSGGASLQKLNSMSADQAALYFSNSFERPAAWAANNAKRQQYANQFLSQFAGSGGTYSGGSSTTSSGDIGKSAAETAQAIDQAKSDLLQLQDTSQGFADQMQALKLQIVQDREVMYDNMKKTYDAQLAEYDYLQNIQSKNSADWLHTQMNRESAITAEINIQKQSIDYLQQQIKYNNDLTDSQKQILSQDMLQRQQDLLSIEQKLYDTRSQMANEIVDTYKQALTDMKDAATKSIDNMINEINKQADQANYKKKLADAQKSAQDIQDEINKLMLDDSNAAKKRIADLQKQLSDQNNSISQMISDNNKQQQIDNLNAQKDSISTYYDNMLNDEDKFAQMRSNILNINNQSIIDSLNSLSTQVKANVNLLGTSVVNTLIDAINRANGYMGLSTQNAGSIGHIASLSVGGITPNWSGSSGKLAVLHQDEMISNKVDTSNFLKSISLVKDMVTNIFKPSNLAGVLSPATAGGNTYQVYFQVDKMTGNQSDVNNFVTKFVNGIKAKGGVI